MKDYLVHSGRKRGDGKKLVGALSAQKLLLWNMAQSSKPFIARWTIKLLGNSGYRKLIEALERQKYVVYTKDEKAVDRAFRSAYFSDVEELGQAYELEGVKPRITINRPFQIGIVVYQLAKQ